MYNTSLMLSRPMVIAVSLWPPMYVRYCRQITPHAIDALEYVIAITIAEGRVTLKAGQAVTRLLRQSLSCDYCIAAGFRQRPPLATVRANRDYRYRHITRPSQYATPHRRRHHAANTPTDRAAPILVCSPEFAHAAAATFTPVNNAALRD